MFMFRLCALGATLCAAMTVGSGIGAADPASTTPANPFLAEIAAQIGLPAQVWTASGTHTARGYTSAAADPAQIDKLCDPATTYQLVYDKQHATYWIDEPFTCTARTSP
jgi:hypothetical protein